MGFKTVLKWTALVSVTTVLLYLYGMFDPAEYSFFPKCPFLQVTGLQCSGCGSQRAIHQLMQLNVGGAMRANPLVVIAIPYVIVGLLLDAYGASQGFARMLRDKILGETAIKIIFVTIVTFGILRNIL